MSVVNIVVRPSTQAAQQRRHEQFMNYFGRPHDTTQTSWHASSAMTTTILRSQARTELATVAVDQEKRPVRWPDASSLLFCAALCVATIAEFWARILKAKSL